MQLLGWVSRHSQGHLHVCFLPCYVSPSDAISWILKIQSTLCGRDLSGHLILLCPGLRYSQLLFSLHRVPLWSCGPVFRLLPEPCWNTIPQSSPGSPRVYTQSSAPAIGTFGCPHCWRFHQHSQRHMWALTDLLPSTSLTVCQVCGTRGYSSLPHYRGLRTAVPKLMKIGWIETDEDANRESQVNRQKQLKPHLTTESEQPWTGSPRTLSILVSLILTTESEQLCAGSLRTPSILVSLYLSSHPRVWDSQVGPCGLKSQSPHISFARLTGSSLPSFVGVLLGSRSFLAMGLDCCSSIWTWSFTWQLLKCSLPPAFLHSLWIATCVPAGPGRTCPVAPSLAPGTNAAMELTMNVN